MGKTSKPLRLLVHPDVAPLFEELKAKGHEVHTGLQGGDDPDQVWAYDLVLGPSCWRLTPNHAKYIELAVKAGRDLKYPSRKGEEL